MAVRKIRHSWWVDFRWKRTRYRRRSPVNTRSGAATYELTLRERLVQGARVDEEPAAAALEIHNVRFAEFADEWFTTYVLTNNKPSEQSNRRMVLRAHLIPWFGHLPLDAITTQLIEQFKAYQLSKILARKTVNNHLAILARCLRCATQWGHLDHMPVIQLLRVGPSPFKILTPDECERVLDDKTEPMWNLMAHVALRTGMRRGELMALDWTDIHFDQNQLIVSHAVSDGIITSTKTYQNRRLPLADSIRARLQRIAESSGLVFRSPTGNVYSDSGAEKAIQRIGSRTGIAGLGWHTLRHTFATTLAANGNSLHTIKELLGHSTITMTMRYVHIVPAMLEDAIRSLDTSCDIARYRNSGQLAGNIDNVPRLSDSSALAIAA